MKKTVLIIEDNDFMKALLRNLFSSDFEVICMENGVDALKWMNNGNIPGLIISDVMMPKMDGFELIQNVKGSHFFRNVPMVMLSGLDKSDDRIKCLKLGADDFIIKPFNPTELQIRVSRLLKSA